MIQFKVVATGGTFDIIHSGHIELLKNAFSISSKVIIGLTSDDLATQKGKILQNNYCTRLENLTSCIENFFTNSSYQISKLENDFGPAVFEVNVEALVTSDETSPQGDVLNKLRIERNLSPVEVIVVPMVLAKDGKKISTTRIKNSEIDKEGNLS